MLTFPTSPSIYREPGYVRAFGVEHDPEKWTPVFRKDHAPGKLSMIRKSGYRFSERIMRN
jgi:hypothetical protein